MILKNRFAIYTLGCKLNFSESSYISDLLSQGGFILSDTPDYILINSCAVTASAEKKVRHLVAQLSRKNPDAEIILLGCYTELSPDFFKNFKGVKHIFGSADKINVVSFLLHNKQLSTPYFFPSYSLHDRTRSFLKIQDGCDYHCSYCTVATARGESRSDTIENVLKNIEKIAEEEIKEIILTGVNLGDFGRKNGTSFFQLLKAIKKQNIIPRLRISSIEPNLLTHDIIELSTHSERIMPHFHIPLQSGSDRILALMKRRYQRSLFAQKVEEIKKKIPHCCIAIDVIAGFPGESEQDFKDTYHFLTSLPLSYLHVFTYSKRPGTPAAQMSEQVPTSVKKERTSQLIELSSQKKKQFYQEHIGRIAPILVESDVKNGFLSGFSDNYIRIQLPANLSLINEIIPVKIEESNIIIE